MRKFVSEGKKATRADAKAYLSTMKYSESEKYDEFVKLLHDVKHKRIGEAEFVKMAKETLKGHNDLLIGLLEFFPKGYEITVPSPTHEDMLHFIEKVKSRDSRVYLSFVDIIHEFRKEKMPTAQVYQQVARLFHNEHPDLLHEFAQFVPDWFDIPSPNQLQLHLQQEERTSSTVVDSLSAEYQSASDDEHSCVLD